MDVHVFGAGALAMSAIGFTASWLKAVFFADDVLLNALFFFLGKWAFDVIFVLAGIAVMPDRSRSRSSCGRRSPPP